MTTALIVLAAFYLLVGAALWWLQDRMVFPGAGRGDRGVPVAAPAAVVGWIGAEPHRTRIVTVAAPNAAAVALYFGGNGEDLWLSAASARELASHGVEAIGCEYPGYGASPGRPSVASLMATAEVAVAHGQARAQVLQVPLIVVGSSLGSFCAVHAAARGGVAKLVLRAPPTNLAAVAQSQFPWLPVRALLAHRFDNLGPAARLRCPTLVLHGDADTIVPQHFGRELAAAIAGAEFVSVPGGGHNDIDLSPAGPVGATLRRFLFGA